MEDRTEEYSSEKVTPQDIQLPQAKVAHSPLSPAPPPPAPSLGERLRTLPRALRNITVSSHMKWGVLPAQVGYPLRNQLKKDKNEK